MKFFLTFLFVVTFANISTAQCTDCPTPEITNVVPIGNGYYEIYWSVEDSDCIRFIHWITQKTDCWGTTTTGNRSRLYDSLSNPIIEFGGSGSNGYANGEITFVMWTGCTPFPENCENVCATSSNSNTVNIVLSTCDCDLYSAEYTCDQICFNIDEHEFDCVGFDLSLVNTTTNTLAEYYISSEGDSYQLCVDRNPLHDYVLGAKVDADCDPETRHIPADCVRYEIPQCDEVCDEPEVTLECNENWIIINVEAGYTAWHGSWQVGWIEPGEQVCFTVICDLTQEQFTICRIIPDCSPCGSGPSPTWDCRENGQACLIFDQSTYAIWGPICWQQAPGDPTPVTFYSLENPQCTFPFEDLTMPDCSDDPCGSGPSPTWNCVENGQACLIFDQSTYGIWGPICWQQAPGDPTPVTFFLLDNPQCTFPFGNLTMPDCREGIIEDDLLMRSNSKSDQKSKEYNLAIPDFEIRPNPATDEITLKFLEDYSGKFEIFDLSGRQMKNGILNASTKRISIQDFVQGTYFIRLSSSTSNKVLTKKFIKSDVVNH